MNRYFYGNIQELKNKLESLNVQYEIVEDRIIIGNGYIKFKVKELPIRSFSVTRFAEPGLELIGVDVEEALLNNL